MTPFETTLSLIEERLSNRLNSDYRRLWVQGNQRPSLTTLILTHFNQSNDYGMTFVTFKNFRNYRIAKAGLSPEEIESHYTLENSIIDSYVASISTNLTNIIS